MTIRRPVDLERKILPALLVAADEAVGLVTSIVTVFGNVDEGQDMAHPGSFAKTVMERGGRIRVLDMHNAGSCLSALGHPVELREITRNELPVSILAQYPEATGGLLAVTQFNMKTRNGADVFHLIAAGDIREWSYAYDTIKSDFEDREWRGEMLRVRHLREVRLWEYGPVLWGMNPATEVISAKSAASEDPDEEPVPPAGDEAEPAAEATAAPPDDAGLTLAEALAPEDPAVLADAKAGRVLSAANAARVRDALAALREVLTAAGIILDEPAEDSEDDDEKTTPGAAAPARDDDPQPETETDAGEAEPQGDALTSTEAPEPRQAAGTTWRDSARKQLEIQRVGLLLDAE